jgi:ketosteroid isomerase-like protein
VRARRAGALRGPGPLLPSLPGRGVWQHTFPDARTEDTAAYAGEEFGVTEFVGRGTHEGPLKSPAGEIPPTGRSVEFKLCEVYEFRDGKIVSGHSYFDSLGLMTQLGVVAPPGQGGS